MKKLFSLFFAISLTLSACGMASTQPAQIEMPTVTPTATQTPTATFTPLPTISTFTPTFDVSTIVTVTPAEKAECPKENPSLVPEFPYCKNGDCLAGPYHEEMLNYLNAGGSLKRLENKNWETILDLTGDGIKDLIHSDLGAIYIYGCKEGKYATLLEFKGIETSPQIETIIDLNQNGIPEIILSNTEGYAYFSITILEWDSNKFTSLIKIRIDENDYDFFGGTFFKYSITDINNNGIVDIVGTSYNALSFDDLSRLPIRQTTTILSWNGTNYVVSSYEPAKVQYRFQAIQDGDNNTLHNNFEKALILYRDAIFDQNLEWWSKERQEFEIHNALNDYFKDWYLEGFPPAKTATPTPFPTLSPVYPDPAEYPSLAAYAYYRIMLLHLVQGQDAEAASTYQTLRDTFGTDPYAAPYVEMATAFWDSYQSTHKMYDGCAAAIQYAVERPEILIPLGSDYHGAQSHIYVPADVCPFR